jgi:DNA polymerase-3 subunit delta
MILFFYGEETFQSSQSVAQLRRKFLQKNPTGGGLVQFDCDYECNVDKIILALGEQNLFASKKLIIIENFFSNTLAPQQKNVIENLEGDIQDVIVFFEKGNVRKNAVLYKWLDKNAHSVKENKLLEGSDLEKWIINVAQRAGKSMDTEAVRELILFIGNDLWQLSHEIEKLVCYAKQEVIMAQDVHDIVHGRTQADMFEMIEAIISSDKNTALTLLKKQLVSGDDPFHIFSMYAYQVRILLRVGGVVQDNVGDKDTIAKLLKLHPFVVQKSMGMLNRVSFRQILSMHKRLTAIDYDIKRGNCDIKTALDLFVVQ